MSAPEENENNTQNNTQTSEIKEMIKAWVEADEKIAVLNKTLKELKDENHRLRNTIVNKDS